MSIRSMTLAALCALATLAAACGGSAKQPSPAETTARSTVTPMPVTQTPTPPVATTPANTPAHAAVTTGTTVAAAAATATLAADRKFELAPIDGAEIVVRESAPPQYAVHITSGLPSGCAEFADATASRTGDEITITVRNTLPADARIACTQIYGTHEATVELGSDFVRGTTYRVHVNDKTIEFTAQ